MILVNSLTSNSKLLDLEENKERMESMNFQTQGASLRLSLKKIRVQNETKINSLKANQIQLLSKKMERKKHLTIHLFLRFHIHQEKILTLQTLENIWPNLLKMCFMNQQKKKQKKTMDYIQALILPAI